MPVTAPLRLCARNECGRTFKPYGPPAKFCSRSCANAVNNALHPKRVSNRPECPTCGVRVPVRNRRYCSTACREAGVANERLAPWLSGALNASGAGGRIASWAREFLLNEAQWACSLCGWAVPNPMTGRPILTINHIDGNWRNNLRENLEVLCYNCHTLTPTFGSLNRGSQSGSRDYGVGHRFPSVK